MKNVIVISIWLVIMAASVAAAEPLEPGTPSRGELSLASPMREYSYHAVTTGNLRLQLADSAEDAEVRLLVLDSDGEQLTAGGPVWPEPELEVPVTVKNSYTVKLVLLGGVSRTGFTLTAELAPGIAGVPFDRVTDHTYDRGEERMTFTLTADYTGYADLLMTGGDYDLDLYVTAPGGTYYESRGLAADESIFFPVQAGRRYEVEVELFDDGDAATLPFELTAYRVRPGLVLAADDRAAIALSDKPLYVEIDPVADWLDLQLLSDASVDIDMALYADGELLTDSIREGAEERLVAGLAPGRRYIGKLYRLDGGSETLHGTIAVTQAAHLPGAVTAELGDELRGRLKGDNDPYGLFHFTAASPGVAFFELRSGKKETVDLDLQVAAADGRTLTARDGSGKETVLLNAAAGDDFYSLLTIYDRAGPGDYRLRTGLVPTTVAQEGAPRRDWYGLFIGMKEYMEVGDLDYCSKDAHDFWQGMQALGMRPENGLLLIDEAATKAAVEDGLRWLARVAGPEDRVVVFFSGHGCREEGGHSANPEPDRAQDYISPYDSLNTGYRNDLSDDRFAELLNGVAAETQLVVIDSCFAGGFAQELAGHPGRTAFMASAEDQESGESTEFKGGLLVGVLLRAMQQSRSRGVPVGDLVREVNELVPRICPDCFTEAEPGDKTCPNCGAVLGGYAQRPVVISTLADDYRLALE